MLAPEGMGSPFIAIFPFSSAASTDVKERKMSEMIKSAVESFVFFISILTFLNLGGIAVFFGDHTEFMVPARERYSFKTLFSLEVVQ